MNAKRIILVSGILFFVSVLPASAAGFFMRTRNVPGAGEPFAVDVFLDAQGESVGAAEGAIMLSGETIAVLNTEYGGSVIPLWVRPPARADSGAIVFSGAIPGGYAGRSGYLFTMVLRANRKGTVTAGGGAGRVFMASDPGKALPAAYIPLAIRVGNEGNGEPFSASPDHVPPEPFTPSVIRDPRVFDGKWFLVFAAEDRGRGIAGYYVQERRAGEADPDAWIEARAPYLLADQERRSAIFVKAVDAAGNERIAGVSRAHRGLSSAAARWDILFLGAASGIVFLTRKLWRRRPASF